MKTIPFLAFAATLSLSLATPLAIAAAKDCHLKRYTTVDLVEPGDLVPVTIDGHPANMALELGVITMIGKSSVESMKVRRYPLPSMLNMASDYVSVKLVMGGVNFGKARLIVINRGMPSGVAGAIGLDLFAHVDFELDLAHGKLSLFSQNHCAGNAVYWTNEYSSTPFRLSANGALHFPMEIEGKKVEASLGPLFNASVLRADASRALFDFDEFSPGVEVVPYKGRGSAAAHYRAMKITAPGLVISNSKVELRRYDDGCTLSVGKNGESSSYGALCDGIYPLRLGRSVLEQLRIYIATKEKVMYFSAANAGK